MVAAVSLTLDAHASELNRLGCVPVAAQCGRYAELIHRPRIESVCDACSQGFHEDETRVCDCPCHQQEQHA